MRRLALVIVVGVAVVAAVGVVSAERGVVDGVSYDDEIEVSGEPTDEELDVIVSRTMARVEMIRGYDFETRPSVERLDGDEAQNEITGNVTRSEYGDWNDVVWEALLVVGQDRYANEVIGETFGGATQGFYEPGNDSAGDDDHTDGGRVTVVGGVDETTLAHELVHVMQSQRYNLSAERFNAPVQDEQLAQEGIVEGDAQYVTRLYAERCASDWDCYTSDGNDGGGTTDREDGNLGVLMTIYQPYSDGAQFVHELRQRGGWDAVDERYEDVPKTSREVIHVEEFDRINVSFEDEARGNWTVINRSFGRNGYDVAGEASVFVTFWYQSSSLGYGLNVIDTSGFFTPSGEYDTYTYESGVSDGWAGDRIYPYRNDATNETGFVWKSTWETTDDAEEFAGAYLAVLDGHGATVVDNATRRVEGEFGGTYRVARNGTNVTVVRAPTVDAVNQLRPSTADAGDPVNEPIDARPGEPTPGFTAVAALLAVVAVLIRG